MKPVNEKEIRTNPSDADIVEKLYKYWHDLLYYSEKF